MRNGFMTALTGAGFLAASMIGSAALAERPKVGGIDKVQMQAEAVYQSSARPLANGAEVIFEDRLKTGPGARLQSTLVDGTQLTLGENASLIVDEFAYDPSKEGGKLSLDVVQGAYLFVGGKIEGRTGGNVAINTPVGKLGVRGTTVWGGAIDGGYGVLVLDGEVRVETTGGAVTLKKGQATTIYDQDSPPEFPHVWSKEKIDEAVKTISFQ